MKDVLFYKTEAGTVIKLADIQLITKDDKSKTCRIYLNHNRNLSCDIEEKYRIETVLKNHGLLEEFKPEEDDNSKHH